MWAHVYVCTHGRVRAHMCTCFCSIFVWTKDQNTKLPSDLGNFISTTLYSLKQPKHPITRWPQSFSLQNVAIFVQKTNTPNYQVTWGILFPLFYTVWMTKTPNYQMTIKFLLFKMLIFLLTKPKHWITKWPKKYFSTSLYSMKQPKHLITRWPLSFSIQNVTILLKKPKHQITKWPKKIYLYSSERFEATKTPNY